jgi:ABC-type multidrug transport system ATPase subunit
LSEVEACATRVLLIHQGKLVAEGPTEDIRSMQGSRAIEIVVRGERATAEKALQSVDGIADVSLVRTSGEASRLRARFVKGAGVRERSEATERGVAALVKAGLGVREVHADGGSLEDVFASLTRDTASDGAAS